MELFKGTKGDYIIIDEGTGRISIRKCRKNWFGGSYERTTVVFPISAVESFNYKPPVSFFNGTFMIVFDSDDNIYRSYTISLPFWDKRASNDLARTLERIVENFT